MADLQRLTRLTWLFAGAVFALLGAEIARACVEQPEYDANNGQTGTATHVGTWHVSQFLNLSNYSPYTGTAGSCAGNTYSGAQACGKSGINAVALTGTYAGGSVSWTGTSSPSTSKIRFTGYKYKADGSGQSAVSFEISRTATPFPAGYDNTVCPDDFDCSTLANQKHFAQGVDLPDTFKPKDTTCVKKAKIGGLPVNMNCGAFKAGKQPFKRLGPSGQRDWYVQYQFTGLPCDAEPEQPPLDETPIDSDREHCKTGPGGLTWCDSPTQDSDCGYFNDKYVCLKSLQPDKCFTHTDGKRLCAEGAPSPPVPDNGTPGKKAEPDDQITSCTGENSCSVNNYYNTTTNSGSSRPTGTGGNADGSGGVGPGGTASGDGTGEGEEEGGGTASGGATCEAAPVCDGDPIACAQLQQQWKARCVDVEVTQTAIEEAFGMTEKEASGDISGGSPITIGSLNSDGGFTAAACPTGSTISVMGQSIDLDIWEYACQLALLFAPITMLIGYLSAARIVFKGVFK